MSLRADLHAIIDRIADELEKRPAGDDWVNQKESPLGREKHLRLAREGTLPSSKDGRLVLIKRADIEAYIAKHRRIIPLAKAEETEDQAAERIAAGIGKKRR